MMDDLGKPKVSKKPWMESVQLILATPEMLDQIAEECSGKDRVFGLDLETTGLDSRAFPNDQGNPVTVDKIVGFCICPNATKSYYIPVRHHDKGSDANVPIRLVKKMIETIQNSGAVAVFHNAKFDMKFLMHDPIGKIGTWDEQKRFHDTQVMAYLNDSRAKNKGLKYLSKLLLDREMIELEELFPTDDAAAGRLDFSKLDPRWDPVVWYAASDALNTFSLFLHYNPLIFNKDEFGNGQKTVYLIERLCLIGTMWMEQNRIYINRERLIELMITGQKEWWDCLEEVYDTVSGILERDVRPPWMNEMKGAFNPKVLDPNYMAVRERFVKIKDSRPPVSKSVPSLKDPKVRETVSFKHSYDVTIPGELGMMFRELGVKGLVATEKSGQVATDADTLEEVIKKAGDQFVWMKKIIRFREIAKAIGGMLFKIYRDTTPERCPDGCVWANFNALKVDTGRFSTPAPSDKKNFFGQVDWNVHSTTAAKTDPKDPAPECSWRQREVIAARPGFLLFAIDYSGVELRIVTNISGEPKWMTEFFHCSGCDRTFERSSLPPPFCPDCGSDKIGDIHTLTAIGVYGEESRKDKEKFVILRGIGKVVNFLLCYGGSGNAVMNSVGCDKEEGWRIKNQFDKTYKGLLGWWQDQAKVARKQKYVTTAFGRKYPVPDIDHEISKFRSKAERNAVNGPVQGTSADIMKLAMGLIYQEMKKRGWLDKVLMTITIHDELVFEIHESLVDEAIPVLENLMCVETVKNLKWIVPLKVDIEFGDNWTVPNNLTTMTWGPLDKKNSWNARWARIFPSYYQTYLGRGGKPITEGGSESPQKLSHPVPPQEARQEAPSQALLREEPTKAPEAPPVQEFRVEKSGSDTIYILQSHKLTVENSGRLAKILMKCAGKGVDLLRIQDEFGNDLLEEPIRVAIGEFKILVGYEGL